jgi:GNAT superfamily N-acetyltransferase
MENAIIRKATKKDSREFLNLLIGLANFEHLDPPNAAAKHRIISDIFVKKGANLFLALVGSKPVGYALYFFTYSSFLAKPTLYLEDIFVLEKFRRKKIGLSLFMKCIDEAARNNCGRFEFSVLTWNRNAIKFYEKLGAKRLKEWYYYRITQDTIKKLRMPDRNRKRKSQLA